MDKRLFRIPIFLWWLLGVFPRASHAQTITCTAADSLAVVNALKAVAPMIKADFGESLVAIGKTFLGTPYLAKTLESGETETLTINFSGLDCTTFVENVLALGITARNGSNRFSDFIRNLEEIRYRDGQLDGYASRLHYFTDWIADNDRKGLVVDVTNDLNGVPIQKQIDFMGTHRDLYPFLGDDAIYKQIRRTEERLSQGEICYLPQDKVAIMEAKIHSGDIIALTTSIDGLDVIHTGLATREDDGKIHLLHASSHNHKVEVGDKPLAQYLKTVKNNTGILIARPQ